jgi:dihydroorotate dehydrogenase (fumarate)/dihydroorotate dehydrogenase
MHEQSIRVCRAVGALAPARSLASRFCGFSDPRLLTDVSGIRFPNPVGLAAGYDKSGKAIAMMAAIGFGFVEIGSVSAFPSAGNPRPRLWRLPADRAICVYYGLPNDGADVVGQRLAGKQWPVPLGINIVKTNRGIDAPPERDPAILDDYLTSVRLLGDRADYLCLNLSCPNTEMGRDFFADPGKLAELLSALGELRLPCPVFLKLSPLGGVPAIEQMLQSVEPFEFISGFIFNLPPGKPATLRTPRSVWESLPGAVAGEPARAPINECVGELYRRMNRARYRIMAAGGIFSAEDAYEKIRLGASLVQVLTGLIYEGPGLVKRINRGLCRLLERDGFTSIAEAVGTGH